MGLGIGFGKGSFSSYDKRPSGGCCGSPSSPPKPQVPQPPPNPDPSNFKILRMEELGTVLVIEVIYPDCTNYEGRKILLYDNVTLKQLVLQGTIDPHFSENSDFHPPVARFEPTPRGWAMATWMANQMENL